MENNMLSVAKPAQNAEDRLLSVRESARILGNISPWTVYAWLSQGKLRRTKVGSRTMIRESELGKVISEGGKSPTPKRCQKIIEPPLLEAGP